MGRIALAAEGRHNLLQAGDGGVLRVITCGSVDDGKSTLIGRLLFDSKLLFEDQLRALEQESAVRGSAGSSIDFALLLDGLEAEREQGITIDVAYRFFATERRKFIVADTPGHEQYTRNMATGASTADLAIILVDARKGILTQTRRHTYIANMMGVRHLVLAVNKMDLVDHSQARFEAIVAEFQTLAHHFSFASATAIPLSARLGDNVFTRSASMAWHDGPTLMDHLEAVETMADDLGEGPLRFPVQWVNRPDAEYRGFAGTLASGSVSKGAPILVSHSGVQAPVADIQALHGSTDHARAGDAVTLLLDREVDIARGDLLVSPQARPHLSDQLSAEILWMSDEALVPGRSYWLKSGGQDCAVSIAEIRHQVDVNTLGTRPSDRLGLNEIGLCALKTTRPIAFDAYDALRETGSFILIDRYSHQTVGAGMIKAPLQPATHIHAQAMDVAKAQRASLKGQKPAVLWFTGLSGAGKSTIANLVDRKLTDAGYHTFALDGDNLRQGLNQDLGFSDQDRAENIRRVGQVAKLFVEAGLIVTCSLISPFASERQRVRDLLGDREFIEVFIDTPIEECMRRDPKGLYRKVQRGEIETFTGIDSPYEAPERPELHIKTADQSAEAAADRIIAWYTNRL